jgi:hypothetical protein
MKNFSIFLLICILCLSTTAQAFMEDITHQDQVFFRYPEEKHKKIDIRTIKSPLEYSDNEVSKIKESMKYFNLGLTPELSNIVTEVGFNKFSLGTGLVNVTFQVRNGVRYALKDVLTGYPEYQRRKAAEEVLNSNINSHLITNRFLTGSSLNTDNYSLAPKFFDNLLDFIFGSNLDLEPSPNLLITTHTISKKLLISKLHDLFSRISYILLVLLTSLAVLKKLTESSFGLNISCLEPLGHALIAVTAIILSPLILDWLLRLAIVIQIMSNKIIEDFFVQSIRYKTLAETWQEFANSIGYMPAQLISYLDVLAQCFVYFFIAGLILHVIIGIIISPIWSLGIMSNNLRSSAYNSFVNWAKTVLVIALIPILFTIVKFISQEFDAYGYHFLEIVISIASYIYLPAISNIILAKSSGIIQPAFSGYQIIADSINNSYNGIKSSLELQRHI